ncbi:hypothetical protein O0L34_g1448 [Tuta absoluta]|nr:hypothetical protein O0L34_g1448 [Tuta absoluta]
MIFFIYTLIHVPCVACFKWFNNEVYDPAISISGVLGYVAKIEDVPHHVLVYYARWYCSGSLVSSRAIVTCATCFVKRDGQNIFVKVGSTQYLDSRSQRIRVIEIKTHEFYRRLSPVDNDIAILFLEKNVKLAKNVQKIPLAEPDTSLRIGHSIRVSGYGGNNVPPKLKNLLLRTTFTIAKDDVCISAFGHIMTPSNYCGELYNTENRLSDNGGGATLMNVLVGILVAGANTDRLNAAILTNVSYFHRWIVLNTRRYHETYCNKTVGSEESGSYEDDYGIALLTHRKLKKISANL